VRSFLYRIDAATFYGTAENGNNRLMKRRQTNGRIITKPAST
jgi:hypothetical protein